jgi:hypothetical protein
MKTKFIHLDANESAFFERQLEHVKAQTYDVKYSFLKAASGEIFQIDTSASNGDETITYQQYDQFGMAKIISDYADDLPRSDVKGTEFTAKVRSIGASYGYNVQEVRRAQRAGLPLQTRKSNAARRAVDSKIDRIAWYGDPDHGLFGLLNNPNITAQAAPAGATTSNVPWIGGSPKNSEEILEDMNKIVRDMIELTKGMEAPDTILLPVKQHAKIHQTRLDSGTDTTIAEFFLRNNPSVRRILWINELKDVIDLPSGASGPKDVMVALDTSMDTMALEIPQPFEQFDPEQRNLEFVVNCHARCGGLTIYYPLAVSVYEGI